MTRTVVCYLTLATAALPAAAQNIHPTTPPEVRAVELSGSIRLDGRLDEAVWLSAPPATDFRQTQPNESQPATQRTEIR